MKKSLSLLAVGAFVLALAPTTSSAAEFGAALRSCQAAHGTAPALPAATDYPGGLSPRGGGLTPATAPGATTINPKAAHCLMQRLGDELVVIQPMEDPEGIVDAQAWAALGSGREPNEAQRAGLHLLFHSFTGGQFDRPILVYCHHTNCFLSYNAIIHLKNAGYTNLLWMREGIAGWRKAGLPVGLVRIKGERPVTAATHAKLDELASVPTPKWACSVPSFSLGNAPPDAERRMDVYRACADKYLAETKKFAARVEAITESKDFQRMNRDLRDKATESLEQRVNVDFALFRQSESRYKEIMNAYENWYAEGPGVSDQVLQKALGVVDAHYVYDCPRISIPSSLASTTRDAIEARVAGWNKCQEELGSRWLEYGIAGKTAIARKTGAWKDMSSQQREIFEQHVQRKWDEAWGVAAAEEGRIKKALVALGMRKPEPKPLTEEEERKSMDAFIEAMEGLDRQKR